VPALEDPLVAQGEWLRAQLAERGWTAEQLVQEAQAWAYRNDKGEIGMTRSHVSEWLSGKRGISAINAERIAGALGVKASRFIDGRSAKAGKLDNEALGLHQRGVGTANRRTAIKAITVVGGLGALGGRHLLTDAAAAAVAASRKRTPVDPMTLEELDQNVEPFALDCLSVPHAELFPQVWDDWRQVEQFLDGRQNLKDRAHLTLLGGQLTYFLARLSFNMGDYAIARRHAVLAWDYAEDVGQAVLCASVRTLQGTIAFYAGQHQKSLELLQATEPYDTPYTRSRIAANMARAYAALGDRSNAEEALKAMEDHLVDMPVQPGDAPYTTATAMSALASTFVRLGDGDTAEEYARQAVASHDAPDLRDTHFEDRGNAALNLAASLAVRRHPEPEEAARLGTDTISVPEAKRTETVRQRAMELSQLMGDWRMIPAVKDFHDRLRAYELPASAA